MEATKNRARSSAFNCFKPVVDDDYEPGFDEAAVRRKRRLRRSFSAALTAVLFKTSSLKKSKSESCKEDGSRGNLFSRSKKLKNSIPCKPDLGPEEISRTSSDRYSIFSSNSTSCTPSLTSSSSSSSSSSHSRSGSDKITRSVSFGFGQVNQQQKIIYRRNSCGTKSTYSNNYNLTLEMCVVLVSLGALVWGKVFAIVICTSLWLFIAPTSHRHRSNHRQQFRRFDSFDVIDSEEYKKRVVMEGWLERNR